jgi:hypothetical protein
MDGNMETGENKQCVQNVVLYVFWTVNMEVAVF